jgi:hypothetical protein
VFTHLDNLSPVYLQDPVNRQHPLNRGRVVWYLTLRDLAGGITCYDMMGQFPAALTSMATSTAGWRASTQPGSEGRLLLDGSGGITAPIGILNQMTSNVFSYAAWIYPTGSLSTSMVVCDSAVASSARPITIAFVSASQIYVSAAGSGGATIPLSTNLQNNVWQRLVVTGDSVTGNIYLNGVLVGTATATPFGSNYIPAPMQFGINGSGGGANFTGSLNSISVWNRPLTTSEVLMDYNMECVGLPGILNRWQQKTVGVSAGIVINALVGTLALTTSLSALLSVTDVLVSILSIVNAETGNVTSKTILAGTETFTSALSGNTIVSIPLLGSLSDTQVFNGTLTNNTPGGNPLVGTLADAFSLTGNLSLSVPLASSLIDNSALTGILTVSNPGVNTLVGTVAGQSAITGSLSVSASVLSQLILASSLSGNLQTRVPISGNFADGSTFIGTLGVSGDGHGSQNNLSTNLAVSLVLTGNLLIGSLTSTTLVTFSAGNSSRATP